MGVTVYRCRNYRQNKYGISIARSSPRESVVLADLYRPDGTFYGTAAVADCHSVAEAIRYAEEMNEKHKDDPLGKERTGVPVQKDGADKS